MEPITKRLFIAIQPTESTIQMLTQYAKSLRLHGIRWTAPQNLHITLHFLGNVEIGVIEDLKKACADTIKKHHQFMLKFKYITLAPPQDPCRMIWAEYYKSIEYVSLTNELKKTTAAFLAPNNFDSLYDDTESLPHITLARCDKTFMRPQTGLPQIVIPELSVQTIQLIESKLNQQGSTYTAIQDYFLSLPL